jgi:Nucleotidyltransferase domain
VTEQAGKPEGHKPASLGDVLETLRANRAMLCELGVTYAAVFGSLARGDGRPDSDVDILVELDRTIARSIFDLGQIQYRDFVRCRKNRLPDGSGRIHLGTMIRGGFLTAEERRDLTELAEHRLARWANALVLLDRGMSCEEVGRVRLIDDDTVRTWHCLFQEDGIDGLAGFTYGGRASQLTLEQQAALKAWVGETPPCQ